ncbi:hypothetical protein POTOM_049467 [Populus tomentosa]|uniref:Uncharacterized protein n=1 Tax=Populus tomentosa TaxID=118781 RepID=A0A8X7Y6E3_POPTO|nr:hypothetical protein POTOM_049467 [Populus tomentosa]
MHTAAKTVVSKPPNPAYRDERSFAAVLSNANPSDDSHKIISVTYAPSSHDRNWLVRSLIGTTNEGVDYANTGQFILTSMEGVVREDKADDRRAGLDKSEYLELNFISGESMVKLDVWESLLENDEAHADMVDNVPETLECPCGPYAGNYKQSFASFISPIADPYELQEMEANQKRLLRETRSQPSSQLKGQGKKSN